MIGEHRLPAAQLYTSEVEDITIDMTQYRPEVLYRLLQWPKALKKLNLGYTFKLSAWLHKYTTVSVQQLLDFQSQSLEHVLLPTPLEGRDVLSDFSHCNSLTYLNLSSCNVFRSQTESAVEKLSSPHFETLHIRMGCEDEDVGTQYKLFEQSHADWTLEFATHYRSRLLQGSLWTIHVDFPSFGDFLRSRGYGDRWPNHYIAAVKPAVVALGFDLTWPEPAITENEWSKLVEMMKIVDGAIEVTESTWWRSLTVE